MPLHVHIIVEALHGHWSAWFKESPHVGYGGEYPSEAIERLLAGTGANVNTDKIIEFEAAHRDGHMEFLIPTRFRLIPTPSVN